MKHLIINEGSRHYLQKNGEKLRVIPKKYQDLLPDEVASALVKHKGLTLTDPERFTLEYLKILSDLKIEQPHLHHIIGDARPITLEYIQPSGSDAYYELLLDNGLRIKAPAAMAKYYSENIQTIHRNY